MLTKLFLLPENEQEEIKIFIKSPLPFGIILQREVINLDFNPLNSAVGESLPLSHIKEMLLLNFFAIRSNQIYSPPNVLAAIYISSSLFSVPMRLRSLSLDSLSFNERIYKFSPDFTISNNIFQAYKNPLFEGMCELCNAGVTEKNSCLLSSSQSALSKKDWCYSSIES